MYHTRVLLALELRVSRSMERNRVVAPTLQVLRLFFGFSGQFGEGLFEGPLPTTQSSVRLCLPLSAAYPRVKRQLLRRLSFLRRRPQLSRFECLCRFPGQCS